MPVPVLEDCAVSIDLCGDGYLELPFPFSLPWVVVGLLERDWEAEAEAEPERRWTGLLCRLKGRGALTETILLFFGRCG